jgi:hypothetical protein
MNCGSCIAPQFDLQTSPDKNFTVLMHEPLFE